MSAREAEQLIDVEMRVEMRGKRIEGLLDQCFVGERTRRRAEPGEPCRALRIAGEETVQIRTGDAAIGRGVGQMAGTARSGPQKIKERHPRPI